MGLWFLSVAETSGLTCDFDACRTIADANRVYSELFAHQVAVGTLVPFSTSHDALIEQHRRACVRIIDARESKPAPTHHDPTKPRSRDVRNWARLQGIGLAKKGKVPSSVVDDYCIAHGMPVASVAPMPSQSDTGTTSASVRAWARSVGIAVGSRGRVHPDIIQKFLEAH